ncbi:MAG TPA: hypothetical protein VHY31_01440 [Streptosporangiaceae bacterium]|jgi:hypothetical protein|nr:hypothetical protein [Streptosporangiaceae bacterium]
MALTDENGLTFSSRNAPGLRGTPVIRRPGGPFLNGITKATPLLMMTIMSVLPDDASAVRERPLRPDFSARPDPI